MSLLRLGEKKKKTMICVSFVLLLSLSLSLSPHYWEGSCNVMSREKPTSQGPDDLMFLDNSQ